MKKGIIVTSFGTTHEDTRKSCIEPIEERIRSKFTEYLVMRAFTSRVIISRLKKRDDYFVDNPTEALEKMKDKGIRDIYVQPLLIIKGHEYDRVKREVKQFLEKNPDFNIEIGKPLLTSDLDYEKAVDGLDLDVYKSAEALVFMGHGSDHNADMAYEKLEKTILKKGYNNVFVATVEGEKNLDKIIVQLLNKKMKKVILKPFMLVVGYHAKNDMASDEENSWKTILENNNINVETKMAGLGQIKEIQDIFIDHLKDIIK